MEFGAMGLLAESKRRRAISKDPNNTKWTRDTSTFGQKMLRAQGWKPGQYLGAQNTAHSGMHSAASASYIRVALKDDLKGLGFNQAKLNVVTGLDVFSDLLSRLNGKSSQDIEGDIRTRQMTKTHIYVEQKWGPMRFVRGGLLVGENMVENVPSDAVSDPFPKITQEETEGTLPKEKISKKRKHAGLDSTNEDVGADVTTERKRRKIERRARNMFTTTTAPDRTKQEVLGDEAKVQKQRIKTNKKNGSVTVDGEQQSLVVLTTGQRNNSQTSKSMDVPSALLTDESKSQEATKSKKKSKQKSREKHKEAKQEERLRAEAERNISSTKPDGLVVDDAFDSQDMTTKTFTLAREAASVPMPKGGRNFVRSRFLAAKRQVMMDSKALNQIFMIKS